LQPHRVRPGQRGRGISYALLDGAVAYARAQRAPAIEGYPVDNNGKKVDRTMAYVGTRNLFERAGFTKAADTDSVSGGFPRVVMRFGPALTRLHSMTQARSRARLRVTTAARPSAHAADGESAVMAPLSCQEGAFPPVDDAPVLAVVKQTALDDGCGSAR